MCRGEQIQTLNFLKLCSTIFHLSLLILFGFWSQLLAVEIMISGFVFEDEDFIRPWEGVNDNLERYT